MKKQVSKNFFGYVFSTLTLILPATLNAADFTAADQLFARRAEGSARIVEARLKYLGMISQLSGADRIYAGEQIVRLDAYEGMKLGDTQREQRITIFDRCLKDADLITPDLVGPTAQYYYWKGVCLAQWARANGILESLFRSGELFDYLDAGEAIDETYEGGGFYRVKGALYSKLPGFNPFGPTQDFDLSVELLQQAIAAPAYSQSRHPATDTGDYFYSNYYYYAETLITMGQQSDAIAVLDEAMARIEAGDLPPGREPEERVAYDYMKRLRSSL